MKQSIMVKLFIIFIGLAVISGAAVLGFTQSAEVRGDSEVLDVGPETAVGEPVARVDTVPETLAPAREEMEDWRAYLLGLEAEAYTTYTDPVRGFSFDYPKAFNLLTDVWEDEKVVSVYHPTLALGMRVSVHPFDPNGERVAELAAIPDEYELEAPEGAQSWAVGWIDQDVPVPGEQRGVYWFRTHDHIFNIQLTAPDVEWLQLWMRQVVYTDFMLTQPSQAL